MKSGLTTISRIIVYLMLIAVLAVVGILFPELAREEAVGKANPPSAYPFLIAAWVFCIPIFIALYQTLKLLRYLDENKAFSIQSVRALQIIKVCSMVFSLMIVIGVITLIIVARIADPREDVTGFITLAFIFTFASSIIATFIAVLQRLLQNAIDMKLENDSTV